MAGTVMHLVVADALLDTLKIQNPALFYCGNLAPDAIMSKEGYVRDMKRHTHFKDDIRLHELRIPEKMAVYQKRLMEFYEKYVAVPSQHRELYLGYLIHMLVDELYILYFRDGFVDRLIAEGRAPDDKEFFHLFSRDVDRVDRKLAKDHSFRYPMPGILREESRYEIPGYVDNQALLDSKEFIIRKNFLAYDEQEELQVMTFEQNREFMERCIAEIPGILRERYHYLG